MLAGGFAFFLQYLVIYFCASLDLQTIILLCCASRNADRNENPIAVAFQLKKKHQVQINNRDDACVSLDGDAWAQIQGPQQRRVSKIKSPSIQE